MVDIPGNSTTTTSISVGGSLTNSLEVAGDHDWFRITLTAGQQVVISLGGSGAFPVTDTYLYLRNSAGAVIASDDDGGPGYDSQIVFTAPTSGTYYIDAGAWNEQFAGTYTLSVKPFKPPPDYTNDQIANQLTEGYWDGDDHHFNVTQGGSLTVNLTALAASGRTLARAALAQWSEIIGVTFVEVASGGQITFDDNEEGAFSTSVWSNHIISSSHVNVSTAWLSSYGTDLNSYSYQTYLHEIGHALGLGHAGNYNGDATYPNDALFANDSWATSIMSYFSQDESSFFSDQGFTRAFAITPTVADILAMQDLYGLSTSTRSGNTVYGFNSTAGNPAYGPAYAGNAFTIFDTSGNDTLNYSQFGFDQLINLNPETFSNVGGSVGNLTIARGTIIENAYGGSGNDTLIGNSAHNLLNGGGGSDSLDGRAGNDILNGGAGADSMSGGTGNDLYYVDRASDMVIESAGEGIDEVRAAVSYTLAADVETLVLTGSASINGTGNDGDNRIVGNTGANFLSGLGGTDTMNGGAGSDTLDGGAGNDSLNGGTGADSMSGGTGNDTYYVDSAGDTISELAGEGTDTVGATVSYTLADNVETLVLTGSASIDGTGNDNSNRITGNAGANVLSGLGATDYLYGVGGNDTLDGGAGNDLLDGGTGSDAMAGGTGNDIHYVDSAGDTVTELAGEGFDTVRTTVSYTLAANAERLELIGSASIDGTGNDVSNRINGNGGANVLSGLGGNDIVYGLGGNDTLDGGAGRDFLVGGTGADSFVFDDGDFWGLSAANCDRIDDFSQAQGDTIDLLAVDADINASGDQGFAFIGSGEFSGTAGELRYEQSGANTLLYGDTDGDGSADFLIMLLGSHSLTGGDFILG